MSSVPAQRPGRRLPVRSPAALPPRSAYVPIPIKRPPAASAPLWTGGACERPRPHRRLARRTPQRRSARSALRSENSVYEPEPARRPGRLSARPRGSRQSRSSAPTRGSGQPAGRGLVRPSFRRRSGRPQRAGLRANAVAGDRRLSTHSESPVIRAAMGVRTEEAGLERGALGGVAELRRRGGG